MPAIAVFVTVWVALGCGSTPKTRIDPLRQFPSDFSIDMAIFAPTNLSELPADLKPGVFMLEPGGSVYIRMGASAIDRGHPPFTGRMSPTETARVWHLIQDSGLFAIDNPNQVSASTMVDKRFDRSVAGLVVTAHGHRRWYKVALDTSSADAATVRSLVGDLSQFGPMP